MLATLLLDVAREKRRSPFILAWRLAMLTFTVPHEDKPLRQIYTQQCVRLILAIKCRQCVFHVTMIHVTPIEDLTCPSL